jgi:hypothetical protein
MPGHQEQGEPPPDADEEVSDIAAEQIAGRFGRSNGT